METPLISVIIPVYNGSKTLGECLDSLFKNNYSSFECIVVDDKSNDDSLSIAKSFDTVVIAQKTQKGAAHARNCGAEAAKGGILLFIDADVTLHTDCLEKIARAFENEPEVSAVFGSYDDEPGNDNFLSQYKNLFHHYIHQTSGRDASTFWTACGAVKKEAFIEAGRFNDKCRMMEDIDLGYRLKKAGYKIVLDKEIVVKHLKRYSLLSLLKSDFFDRAIPWTILLLSNKQFANDLNLKGEHKLSAVALIISIIFVLLSLQAGWMIYISAILMVLFFYINRDFYGFYLDKRGAFFTLKVIPFHFLYYLYSTLGFIVGHYKFYVSKKSF